MRSLASSTSTSGSRSGAAGTTIGWPLPLSLAPPPPVVAAGDFPPPPATAAIQAPRRPHLERACLHDPAAIRSQRLRLGWCSVTAARTCPCLRAGAGTASGGRGCAMRGCRAASPGPSAARLRKHASEASTLAPRTLCSRVAAAASTIACSSRHLSWIGRCRQSSDKPAASYS